MSAPAPCPACNAPLRGIYDPPHGDECPIRRAISRQQAQQAAQRKADAPSEGPGAIHLLPGELAELRILAELLTIPHTINDDPSVAPRELRRIVEGIAERAGVK